MNCLSLFRCSAGLASTLKRGALLYLIWTDSGLAGPSLRYISVVIAIRYLFDFTRRALQHERSRTHARRWIVYLQTNNVVQAHGTVPATKKRKLLTCRCLHEKTTVDKN